jgi:hypothetical protein
MIMKKMNLLKKAARMLLVVLGELFLFANAALYAQTEQAEKKKETFGIHVAPLFALFESHEPLGELGKSYRPSAIDFGIEYTKQWTKRWTFGSGIDFIANYDDFEVAIISVPLLFRYNFNKYIYADIAPAGYLVLDNFSTPFIGGKIALGFEYEFDNGLVLSLSPYTRLFYFIPLAAGISLGAAYRF